MRIWNQMKNSSILVNSCTPNQILSKRCKMLSPCIVIHLGRIIDPHGPIGSLLRFCYIPNLIPCYSDFYVVLHGMVEMWTLGQYTIQRNRSTEEQAGFENTKPHWIWCFSPHVGRIVYCYCNILLQSLTSGFSSHNIPESWSGCSYHIQSGSIVHQAFQTTAQKT